LKDSVLTNKFILISGHGKDDSGAIKYTVFNILRDTATGLSSEDRNGIMFFLKKDTPEWEIEEVVEEIQLALGNVYGNIIKVSFVEKDLVA